MVLGWGSTLMELPGVGHHRRPTLADVGDVARFTDRTGSRPGPAPHPSKPSQWRVRPHRPPAREPAVTS